MSNWWLAWAEQIARTLANSWIRSSQAGPCDDGANPASADRPAEPKAVLPKPTHSHDQTEMQGK